MKEIVKQFKKSLSELTPEEFKKVWDEIEAEIGTDYPVFNAKTKCFEYKINNTETLEQAAEDYANSFEYNDYTIETEAAFKAGVEFAQRWISIEDELPNFDKENPFKKYLVKVIEGSITSKEFITTSHLRNQLGNWSCEMDWVRVTHWRPIELN